jgi:hypothetical protein
MRYRRRGWRTRPRHAGVHKHTHVEKRVGAAELDGEEREAGSGARRRGAKHGRARPARVDSLDKREHDSGQGDGGERHPGTSSGGAPGRRDSGSQRSPSGAANSTKGTLTRNTQRQPARSTSTPPITALVVGAGPQQGARSRLARGWSPCHPPRGCGCHRPVAATPLGGNARCLLGRGSNRPDFPFQSG